MFFHKILKQVSCSKVHLYSADVARKFFRYLLIRCLCRGFVIHKSPYDIITATDNGHI